MWRARSHISFGKPSREFSRPPTPFWSATGKSCFRHSRRPLPPDPIAGLIGGPDPPSLPPRDSTNRTCGVSPLPARAAHPVKSTAGRGDSWETREGVDTCPPREEVNLYIPVSTPCIHHDTHKRKHEHSGCRFYWRCRRSSSDPGVPTGDCRNEN